MKSRASNKTLEARRYFKRNLTVSARWMRYENFLEDMGECPSTHHSIDRIDNDLGYSKENCRWATQKQQQRNKSSNRIVEYNGESMCVSEFAERIGARYHAVAEMVRSGKSCDAIAIKLSTQKRSA